VRCALFERDSAWNNLLRGGASLLLRSEEKSWPDWNGSKGRELNSQDQSPPAQWPRAGKVDMRSSEVRRMPFDGTDAFDNHPIAKLGAVERMLATEQQWCKGRLRDAHGRHCLVGAIEAVGGRQVLQKPILQAAREVSGKRYWRIEFFNDDPRTTHVDVLQVLRRTRENMIAGMISSYDRQPRRQRWIRALRVLFSRPGFEADVILPEGAARFSSIEPFAQRRELEGSGQTHRVLELQH
jgi:hypothetical protein